MNTLDPSRELGSPSRSPAPAQIAMATTVESLKKNSFAGKNVPLFNHYWHKNKKLIFLIFLTVTFLPLSAQSKNRGPLAMGSDKLMNNLALKLLS